MNINSFSFSGKTAVPSFINTNIDNVKWYQVILNYIFKIIPIITGVFGLTIAVLTALKLSYDTTYILMLATIAVCSFTLVRINTVLTLSLSAISFASTLYVAKISFFDNIGSFSKLASFFNDYYIYLVQTIGFGSTNQPAKALAAVLNNAELLNLYIAMACTALVIVFSLFVSICSFKTPLPFLYLLLCIAVLSPFLYFGIISSQLSIYLISISVFCAYVEKTYSSWYIKNTERTVQEEPIDIARNELRNSKSLADKMNARKKYIMCVVFDGKIVISAFLLSLFAIFLINFYYMSGVEKTNFNGMFSNTVEFVTQNINKDDIGNAFGVGNDIGQGKINENGQDLSNTKLVKIFPSDTETVYLRTWAGANYSNDRWTSLNPENTEQFKKLVSAGVNPQSIMRNYLWVTKGVNISKNYKYSFDKNLGLSFLKVGVGYIDIRTGLLCVPPMFITNSLESDNLEWGYTGDGILSFKRNLLNQPAYFVDTIIPKYNTAGFKATFLDKQKDYEKIAANVEKTMNTEQGKNITDTNYNLVRDELLYRKFVYDNYLSVPQNMGGELTELAKSITQNSKTTFEKAEKIRTYLAQNYTYNLTPPNNQKLDAVHYFLFESKQGFCSHYASSMSLMLRTLGIPTRYSTGYVVQTQDYGDYNPVIGLTQDSINDRAGITVYPRYAHAWCEVYFDGIGWLPFEATTSISNPMYIEQTEANAAPTQDFEYDTEEEFEEEQPKMLDEGIEVKHSNINYKLILEILLLIISAVGLLLFIRLFVHLLLAKYNTGIRRELFEQFEKRDAVNDIFEYIIDVTQTHIAKINGGELLLDYAKRVDKQMNNSKTKLTSIIPIVQMSAFSKHEITELDRTAVIVYARYLRDYILGSKKPFDRFIIKYFDSRFNF